MKNEEIINSCANLWDWYLTFTGLIALGTVISTGVVCLVAIRAYNRFRVTKVIFQNTYFADLPQSKNKDNEDTDYKILEPVESLVIGIENSVPLPLKIPGFILNCKMEKKDDFSYYFKSPKVVEINGFGRSELSVVINPQVEFGRLDGLKKMEISVRTNLGYKILTVDKKTREKFCRFLVKQKTTI